MASASSTVYLFPTICRSASFLAFKRPITSHSKLLSQLILSCLFSHLKHSLLRDCCTELSYMRGTSSAVHLCSSPFTKWLAIWAPSFTLGCVQRMGESQEGYFMIFDLKSTSTKMCPRIHFRRILSDCIARTTGFPAMDTVRLKHGTSLNTPK